MQNKSPNSSCCTPSIPRAKKDNAQPNIQPNKAGTHHANGLLIPAGLALVGTQTPCIVDDGERPLRKAKLNSFYIGETTVTNAEFEAFIKATDYVTEAEQFGWSFVFITQVPENIGATQGVVDAEWWRRVDGANWRDINGPGTKVEVWHLDHPTVHISWNDASAYAKWVGGRLPTEVEWEHAARGGLADVIFPWGDRDPDDINFTPCNIWQGNFPQKNLCKDGYATTAPAKSFEPNGYGLYNLSGNVWEWTSEPYKVKSLKKRVRQRMAQMSGYKLSKGGSFLCHKSYCYRYRIAARSGSSPDSSTTHHGFRVAWDA